MHITINTPSPLIIFIQFPAIPFSCGASSAGTVSQIVSYKSCSTLESPSSLNTRNVYDHPPSLLLSGSFYDMNVIPWPAGLDCGRQR